MENMNSNGNKIKANKNNIANNKTKLNQIILIETINKTVHKKILPKSLKNLFL